jgi:hypothetical protein
MTLTEFGYSVYVLRQIKILKTCIINNIMLNIKVSSH